MDVVTRKKWDAIARSFDVMNSRGPEMRWAPTKREFFAAMRGKVLFVAVGTGLDIQFFPPDCDIVGIDISPGMLAVAKDRADAYPGALELLEMDVHELPFAAGTFDQVFTSCTFCSVPDPVRGLEVLRRVLVPGGELRMFEHTGSRYFPVSGMLHMMTWLFGRFGPDMDRPTVENVQRAGFEIREVENFFLDVVKTITAVAPQKRGRC